MKNGIDPKTTKLLGRIPRNLEKRNKLTTTSGQFPGKEEGKA
tara:strand:+ start:401 stop:526 length:126 start_codon:yes stop_codon:yes gene_type:complete